MATVNISDRINKGRFNGFYLAIFIACFLTIIFDGYDFNVFGNIVPVLMKDWHLKPTVVGLLGSYGLFGMLIGAIGFGMLADKIGRKRSIIIGISVYCLFNGLVGSAPTPTAFAVLRFVGGLGLGGVMPNVVSLLSEYSPLANRATIITSTFIGVQVGAIAASALAIGLLPGHGWRIMFWVALVPLILIPLFIRILPESASHYLKKANLSEIRRILQKVDPEYVPKEDDKFQVTGAKEERSSMLGLFQERRTLNTIMFWIVYFLNLFMIFAIGTWLPKLMMSRGYALGSAIWLLLTFNLGSMAGSIVAGRVADVLGYKRVLVFLYLLAFVCIALLGIKSNIFTLSVLIILGGCAINGGQNLAHAYVAGCHPLELRSTALGWALGVGRLGAIAAPTFGGILLAMNVAVPAIFIAFAIPGLIAALAVGVTRGGRPQAAAPGASPHAA